MVYNIVMAHLSFIAFGRYRSPDGRFVRKTSHGFRHRTAQMKRLAKGRKFWFK